MKKSIITVVLFALVALFLIISLSFTGYSAYQEGPYEKTKLGYCPTMRKEAKKLTKENNSELIGLGSSSEVLYALRNGEIDKALIGRKAELAEISPKTKETVLKSGYTLVSDKKGFMNHSSLASIEVYTYLPNEVASRLIPTSPRIIYENKNETFKKINEGKITLISWDDWDDNLGLIVVMDKDEKVKDFRGTFLYEN